MPGENAVVDRQHNAYRAPYAEISTERTIHARRAMQSAAYVMDERRRVLVRNAILETCRFRGWRVMAAHVRANHVHVVVDSPDPPEPVMNALKAYASRALNEAELDPPDQRRWARHGSTRYFWNHTQISAAITYVLDKQGERMATFDVEVDGPSAP